MRLATAPYAEQVARWPKRGRHVLANYDADSVVVYQAYRPSIGRFAADHGFFGGDFSLDRMSWIKPNFLWMMFRSVWGTKSSQEITLAVRITRAAFDTILRGGAVPSTFDAADFPNAAAWKKAVAGSDVRLQWDPDHDPRGHSVQRRAVQLGLRGAALRRYAREWIVAIDDISDFVAAQRPRAAAGDDAGLMTPVEHVYPVPAGAELLRADAPPDDFPAVALEVSR